MNSHVLNRTLTSARLTLPPNTYRSSPYELSEEQLVQMEKEFLEDEEQLTCIQMIVGWWTMATGTNDILFLYMVIWLIEYISR